MIHPVYKVTYIVHIRRDTAKLYLTLAVVERGKNIFYGMSRFSDVREAMLSISESK